MIDRNPLFGTTSRLAGVQRRIDRAWHARNARRDLSSDRRDAPGILAAVAAVRPEAGSWVLRDGRAGEPTILSVGPPGAPPMAIIRVARSRSGQAGLDRAAGSLQQLHARLAGLEVEALLPVVIGRGDLPGRTWLAERALAGHSGRSLLADAATRRRLLVATARAIGTIHAATARAVVVDEAVLGRWVSTRARVIADTLHRARPALPDGRLARIEAAVSADLADRTLQVGWIHGDLWPANILVADDTALITGIVDWDSAEDDELAFHDRLHLAITTRRLVARKELGPVLADLLSGGTWSEDDRAVLDAASELSDRTALWLYWLRFVESNLLRHPDLASDRTWLAANVEQVLACA